MKSSPDCLALVRHFEGCRPEVYPDPIGLPTVGVGHMLSRAELEVWPVGTQLDEAKIEALLRVDIEEAEQAVRDLVTHDLTQAQFDALVSFTFNLGRKNLARSGLLRKVNAGLLDEAATEFLRWTFAGGRHLPGLERRRKAERALFLGHANPIAEADGDGHG